MKIQVNFPRNRLATKIHIYAGFEKNFQKDDILWFWELGSTEPPTCNGFLPVAKNARGPAGWGEGGWPGKSCNLVLRRCHPSETWKKFENFTEKSMKNGKFLGKH